MEQKDHHLDILKDEQASSHDEDMRKNDDERKEEPFTPVHRKELLKRDKAADCIEIVDLAKSPKKRKQDVGMNPYSPSRTPIKGSVLDIQIGKHSLNSPLPSPKPLAVVTPPHSPLRSIVNRANELAQSLSNSGAISSSQESYTSRNSNSLHSIPGLKTMLSSSNSKTMLEFAKTGKLVTSFSDDLLKKDNPNKEGRVLFSDSLTVY